MAEAGSTLTVLPEPLLEVDGVQLLTGLRGALSWLQRTQEEINDLNVYPVPDGDTGSNMYLTLRSAVEEAQDATDPTSAAAVLAAAAHGSLMGARGNSGVILSQILRGFSQGLAGAALLDASGLARCLAEARTIAYKAVMKPTEGTILTVVRAAAEAAHQATAESVDVVAVLEQAVRASHVAVEKTTEQLQVLRDAGVVDAGGFGLAVILEGMSRALAGSAEMAGVDDDPRHPLAEADAGIVSDAPAPLSARPPRRGAAAVEMRDEGWGYCTEFLIHGPGLSFDSLRSELAALGESALVVGDADLVRVHIHTQEPAPLIALAAQRGRLSQLKVEDMSAQHHEVLERAGTADQALAPPAAGGSDGADRSRADPPRAAEQRPAARRKRLGVVSVAPGSGFREILASLGADAVVEGGQTMNPSIEDLLNAVHEANAEGVVLLPNNSNVILTAEQVDGLVDDIEVRVVPTRNLPQGISALLALEPDSALDANCARMAHAIEHVHALEVTRAVRDSNANGHDINEGDVLGILDDEIVEVGADEQGVITAVLRNLVAPELVTVYSGGDITAEAASALVDSLRRSFVNTEFELHDGGQEHYAYVLSLE